GIRAFWWPRFEAIARWFVDHDRARRALAVPIVTEAQGGIAIEGPAGLFMLSAKADRIDRLAGGGLAILDYQTGRIPSRKGLELGYAPQLPLEAVIAREGGFGKAGVDGDAVNSLAYWRLSGGNPPGSVYAFEEKLDDPATLAAEARTGLERLIARFDAE